jgi:hypothetical protein
MASATPPTTSSPGSTRELKTEARGLMDEAKQVARDRVGEQQRAAATGVGDFARALRDAAQKSGDGQGGTLSARAAEMAAERLERLSTSLNNRDLDSVVRDAESFARREPLLFFGAAIAAGFIAMRLMKDAAPSSDEISRRM